MYHYISRKRVFEICLVITLLFHAIESKKIETIDNSQYLPSIEIKLSPPDVPLPELSKHIEESEYTRKEIEDGMLNKLRDTFNKQLVESQERIREVVSNSFASFFKENKSKLFRNASLFHLKDLNNYSSFLQIARNTNAKDDVIPSSVRVMMYDAKDLDPIVYSKISEIEQSRNDLLIQLFDQAENELGEMLKITLFEIKKNLEIQFNAIGGGYAPGLKSSHGENTSEDELNGDYEKTGSFVKKKLKEGKKFLKRLKLPRLSFLQLIDNSMQQKMLNVKFGQPDNPYPTPDDMVMTMEKKRDASENLARNKILNIEMKYIRAHHEMLKDALHTYTIKILSHLEQLHHH